MDKIPRISVIIPAYNEAEFIPQALEALERQTLPRGSYKIIVVDNNSGDITGELAKLKADKVVAEKTQGTNFARQRGVDESDKNTDIYAFCDADCEPGETWLEDIVKYLSIPGVAAVSGPYDFGLTGIGKWLSGLYAKIFSKADVFLFFIFRKKAGVLIGGNFALRKSTLDAIGGLPPEKFWGDDGLTAIMIANTVGRVLFEPKLVMKSSPRRFNREGVFTTSIRYLYEYLKKYYQYKAPETKKPTM